MENNKNVINCFADIPADFYVDEGEKEAVAMLMQHEMAVDGGEENFDEEAKFDLWCEIIIRIRGTVG